MNKNISKQLGFTFLEIIVVIGVLIISLPALFSILYSILQQQTKVTRLSIVKREGDVVLSSLKDTIRNRAFRIYDTAILTANERCGTSSLSPNPVVVNQPIFQDTDSTWFKYALDNNQVASTSATISSPIYLTSSQVVLSNFVFSCIRSSSYSPATIILSFDICFKGQQADCSTTRGEEIANMHYQSYITLRNF